MNAQHTITPTPFVLFPDEIKEFKDIYEGGGFSGKTTLTAKLHHLTNDLHDKVANVLPEGIEMLNTNGAGVKSTIFRRYLEYYNLDLLVDKVLDAFYKQPDVIPVGEFAAECGIKLPAVMQRPIKPKTDKVHFFLEKLILLHPLPAELQNEIEQQRKRMVALYGKNIEFYLRSAAAKGEDEGVQGEKSYVNKRLMKANKSIAKLQTGKMGAGQHESYRDSQFRKGTQSTKQSCVAAMHKVYASTYSFQAIGDYYRKCDENGKWFHSGVDMDVIFMPTIHSYLGGSGLGFSDVIDGITEITFGERVMGDELVGGKKEFPMINTYAGPNGIEASVISGGFLPDSLNGILQAIAITTHHLEAIEAPEEEAIKAIGKKEKLCVDSEWAYGPLSKGSKKMYLSIVQYRTFRPGQIARSTSMQKLFELKNKEKMANIQPVANGTSVGEMCSVGEALWIKNKSHLMAADVKGKILIVPEAYAELLGTISAGAAGWVVVPRALKAHATLNGDGEIMQLQGVHKDQLRVIKNGDTVTVLLNNLYKGNLSDCYEEYDFDLSTLQLPEGVTLSVVEGNTSGSRRRKLFPYSRLGILKHNALFRFEAANWNGGVPALFNWVYYSQIITSVKEAKHYMKHNATAEEVGQYIKDAKLVKKYIEDAMQTYATTDPVEAYIKRMAAVMFPLAAYFKYFDQNCEIRMYGARLEEDHPYVAFDFPHEPNPISGFNGAAMYATPWGRIAATISLKVLKELERYGCNNSSIFIPNIATMEVVVNICEEAIGLGVDLRERGVKLMIENGMAFDGAFLTEDYTVFNKNTYKMDFVAPSAKHYQTELTKRLGGEVSFSTSYGFNDLGNSFTGGDIRHLDMPDRSIMSNSCFMQRVKKFTQMSLALGFDNGNCGLAEEGVLVAMMEAGAKKVGVPVGLKTIKAAQLLTTMQQKMNEKPAFELAGMN